MTTSGLVNMHQGNHISGSSITQSSWTAPEHIGVQKTDALACCSVKGMQWAQGAEVLKSQKAVHF